MECFTWAVHRVEHSTGAVHKVECFTGAIRGVLTIVKSVSLQLSATVIVANALSGPDATLIILKVIENNVCWPDGPMAAAQNLLLSFPLGRCETLFECERLLGP